MGVLPGGKGKALIRMLLWLIIMAVAAFLALAAFLYFYQSHFVFYPSRDVAMTPEQLQLRYEDVYVDVGQGEKIHGWFFPAAEGSAKRRKTILFCHENAGNISHGFETITYLLDMGADLFVFDYRGYGRSDGFPSEENVYADAQAAFQWLVTAKRKRPEEIVIFGRSLGGAVAIDLATRVPCGGLLVESSFTSARDMGRLMFPFFPIGYLLRYRFDSLGKIARVRCPLVVAHSPEDEMIPYDMGRRLFEAAGEPKQLVKLRGGHNDRLYFDDASYRSALEALLNLSGR